MRRHLRLLAASTLFTACASGAACSSSDSSTGDPEVDDSGNPIGNDGSSPGVDGAVAPGTDGSMTPGDGATTKDGATPKDGGLDGALLDAADAADQYVPPPPPSVAFVGRFDTSPAAGPKESWPGATITARFMGTEVSATFGDVMAYGAYGPSRWDVTIDGVLQGPIQPARPQTTVLLASGLAMGTHTVELFRLNEASVGTSQFLGFDFNGGTLLAPPPAATRHLEFLGDSASNGYGIECTAPTQSFMANTQNAHLAFPALVAHDLSADHHNLSASGKGLYWNYSRTDDLEVYSVLFPRTLAFTGGNTWSFDDYTPDVVWITLGGNDWDQPNPGDPPPPLAGFQTKYDQLVTTARTKHPNAYFFLAVAPSLQDGYPSGYNAYTNVKTAVNNIVNARSAGGDMKIYSFEFTRSVNGDLTACAYHPNVAKHRSMADEAVTFIKSKTGWL